LNLVGVVGTFTEILGVTLISILAPVFNIGFVVPQSDLRLI